MAKTCFRCKTKKLETDFFRHGQTSDGLHSWCKACCTIGNHKSRDKVNARIETRAVVFLRNARNAAVKRNQEFKLTVGDIVSMWEAQQKTCPYSGRQMTLEAGKLETVSIERIDSSIGYTPENTILVCQAINRMKSDFEFGDFYQMCADVAQFIGDENLNLNVEASKW